MPVVFIMKGKQPNSKAKTCLQGSSLTGFSKSKYETESLPETCTTMQDTQHNYMNDKPK